MKRLLCLGILLSAVSTSSMESSLFLDTQSRLGYQCTIQSWLRTGLAASLSLKGQNVDGAIFSRKNYGLVAPFIDFRAAAFGLETGLNTYLSFNDGGPTTAPTNIHVYKYAGNWLGSDFYAGRTFRFERFEIVPLIHILRYGYSISEKFHAIGFGFLPEGRFAFRF
jgi:hypothetical protein